MLLEVTSEICLEYIRVIRVAKQVLLDVISEIFSKICIGNMCG